MSSGNLHKHPMSCEGAILLRSELILALDGVHRRFKKVAFLEHPSARELPAGELLEPADPIVPTTHRGARWSGGVLRVWSGVRRDTREGLSTAKGDPDQ